MSAACILIPESWFPLLLTGLKFDQYDTGWKNNYLEHCRIVLFCISLFPSIFSFFDPVININVNPYARSISEQLYAGWSWSVLATYGPGQAKKCLWTCTKWADSDHPAHAQSMIWAFALQSYILYNPMIWLISDSKSPDQTASVQADLDQRHIFAWCGPHVIKPFSDRLICCG